MTQGEHILVCLSSSPANGTIIRAAARMAEAFKGEFTALYVETSQSQKMDEEDRSRLRGHIRLAKKLGAKIETTCGDDIAFQISEFARLSGVTKIVIGRSMAERRHLFGKPPLTEKLITNAPNMDIYIIPCQMAENRKFSRKNWQSALVLSVGDMIKSVLGLAAASFIGILFEHLGFDEANIITVYVLAVLIISVVIRNQIYSLIASIVSVLVFNFLFTDPKYSLMAYDRGYPVTFFVMFIAAFLTGTLASRMKNGSRQLAHVAFRTRVLFETNQLLQQKKTRTEIVTATAHQLMKLLNRDIIFYLAKDGKLGEAQVFRIEGTDIPEDYVSEEEKKAAQWAFDNNRHAGATTRILSHASCLYLAVRINDAVYGVVGIVIKKDPLAMFENSILLSILGECALALENEKNAWEKQEAAVLAKNEQLRSQLLRAISHDLRTPLTSISGNASNLLSNGPSFDEATRQSLYQDIYDDAMWLINLVENLLSVTRLEEGRLNLNMSAELVDEVIKEALNHVDRKCTEHILTERCEDELLLAKMDAKLIVQVVINLVNNAIKYTEPGSHISVEAKQEGKWAVISVADDGPGVPDENKEKLFEMFYSGANRIVDSRRSLGLGLSLCKSIVNAHGGTISIRDNEPHGAVFTFTLPVEEVQLTE